MAPLIGHVNACGRNIGAGGGIPFHRERTAMILLTPKLEHFVRLSLFLAAATLSG